MLDLVSDRAFQAVSAHLLAMTYAGKHGTDGLIPKAALPFIHPHKTDADRLVRVGLWREVPGGWDIHGWDEYELSDDESKARRSARRRAGASETLDRKVDAGATKQVPKHVGDAVLEASARTDVANGEALTASTCTHISNARRGCKIRVGFGRG